MTLAYFNSKYKLSSGHIYNLIRTDKLPKSILSDTYPKEIDEAYFIRRVKFYNKVKAYNQTWYYILKDNNSQAGIARECSLLYKPTRQSIIALQQYMCSYLWNPRKDSITKYAVSKTALRFYRYCKRKEKQQY